MDLHQLLTTLRRRWKFVVAIFLSGLIGAFVFSLAMPQLYESTVRVYFSSNGNTAVDQVQLGTYTAQRVKSYAALAEDTSVLQGVIKRSKVDTTPEAFQENVRIEVIPDTVVLRIAVRDASPRIARTLADAYAAEIGSTIGKFERPTVGAGPKVPSPIEARSQGSASVSSGPVSPNMSLNVGVGAVLGLLFGIGGAVLRELATSKPVDVPPASRRTAPEARRETVPSPSARW